MFYLNSIKFQCPQFYRKLKVFTHLKRSNHPINFSRVIR